MVYQLLLKHAPECDYALEARAGVNTAAHLLLLGDKHGSSYAQRALFGLDPSRIPQAQHDLIAYEHIAFSRLISPRIKRTHLTDADVEEIIKRLMVVGKDTERQRLGALRNDRACGMLDALQQVIRLHN
jgi:hypothetical protein